MAEPAEHEADEPEGHVPPKKKVDKKQWIIVGATVFAAIVGWLIYKKNASSGAAAPATSVVTPAGGGIAGGTSPSAGAPTVSITTRTGYGYTGPATPHPPGLPGGTAGSGTSGSQSNPSTQPNPGAAAATAAGYQPQVAHFTGGTYYVLGGLTSKGQYTGSTVAGGYGVYATWTGQGQPQLLGNAPATAKNLTVYTPTGTPTADIGNPHGNQTVSWAMQRTGNQP